METPGKSLPSFNIKVINSYISTALRRNTQFPHDFFIFSYRLCRRLLISSLIPNPFCQDSDQLRHLFRHLLDTFPITIKTNLLPRKTTRAGIEPATSTTIGAASSTDTRSNPPLHPFLAAISPTAISGSLVRPEFANSFHVTPVAEKRPILFVRTRKSTKIPENIRFFHHIQRAAIRYVNVRYFLRL